MIHVKKSMQIYFSKIICGSRTNIYLYIMDLYLCVAESKVQFATHGKWRLKLILTRKKWAVKSNFKDVINCLDDIGDPEISIT